MLHFILRRVSCASSSSEPRHEVLYLPLAEFQKPLSEQNAWMNQFADVKKYAPTGPKFADGSINWQCPCMGSGSLVAHRCGFYFRKLYTCMSADETKDPAKCPNEFIDWAACMQNLDDERREQMRRAMLSEVGGMPTKTTS